MRPNSGLLGKMKSDLSLENISYNKFEANEDKSISDTLGSIIKCAFNQALVHEDEGLARPTDVVNLIRSQSKEATMKFNFLIIEEFGDTICETDWEVRLVPNISELHSFRLFKDYRTDYSKTFLGVSQSSKSVR